MQQSGLTFADYFVSDYLTDVLASKGVNFINSSAATGQPFFLELATFAPHSPYTPAPVTRTNSPGCARRVRRASIGSRPTRRGGSPVARR
jgi:hypothetical protein